MGSKKILVIGSSNTDMVVQSARLPAPGETILGGQFLMNPGGKGANQAVAAAKLGSDVSFMCRLGKDLFGTEAISNFKGYGMDTSGIVQDENHPSGVALIMVDEKGENCISVALGANNELSKAQIDANRALFEACEIVLIQLEIPISTVEHAVQLAKKLGKTVILNPAPAHELSTTTLSHIDIITPNETELQLLSGHTITDDASIRAAAQCLLDQGAKTVIVTLGKRGAFILNENLETVIPAPTVQTVDTTAAGDTFNGALAVALSDGKELKIAIEFANRAAAFSVTKLGAQSSTPTLEDLK
ncbi:MAG: ribokinase [Bacteroidota bacterium]